MHARENMVIAVRPEERETLSPALPLTIFFPGERHRMADCL